MPSSVGSLPSISPVFSTAPAPAAAQRTDADGGGGNGAFGPPERRPAKAKAEPPSPDEARTIGPAEPGSPGSRLNLSV